MGMLITVSGVEPPLGAFGAAKAKWGLRLEMMEAHFQLRLFNFFKSANRKSPMNSITFRPNQISLPYALGRNIIYIFHNNIFAPLFVLPFGIYTPGYQEIQI